jgi:hypothetical protein
MKRVPFDSYAPFRSLDCGWRSVDREVSRFQSRGTKRLPPPGLAIPRPKCGLDAVGRGLDRFVADLTRARE